MAHISIDVELDEFDLSEILDELEFRYDRVGRKGKSNKEEIDNFIKRMKIDFDGIDFLEKLSMLNKMKMDFLIENLDAISLDDLEKIKR